VADGLYVIDRQVGEVRFELGQEGLGGGEICGLTVGPSSLLFDFETSQQEAILVTEIIENIKIGL
jgi:hypothetical protein